MQQTEKRSEPNNGSGTEPTITASGFEAWWASVKHCYHPESLRVYAEAAARHGWSAAERVRRQTERLRNPP